MFEANPPLGLIGKALKWFADLAAMPGRLRALSESVQSDQDARPKCMSCGIGRVGDLSEVAPNSYPVVYQGTCNKCGKGWTLTREGKLLRPRS